MAKTPPYFVMGVKENLKSNFIRIKKHKRLLKVIIQMKKG